MKWPIQIVLGVALLLVTGVGQSRVSADQRNPVLQTISIQPRSGSTVGGTVVTIVGAGFTARTAVNFGYVPATMGYERAPQIAVQSATMIKAVTPPHASGTVDLVVSNPDGSSATLTNAFTYTDR